MIINPFISFLVFQTTSFQQIYFKHFVYNFFISIYPALHSAESSRQYKFFVL